MGFSKVKNSIELYRKKYNMVERFPYKKYFLDVNRLLLEAQEYKPWYGTEKMRKEERM